MRTLEHDIDSIESCRLLLRWLKAAQRRAAVDDRIHVVDVRSIQKNGRSTHGTKQWSVCVVDENQSATIRIIRGVRTAVTTDLRTFARG